MENSNSKICNSPKLQSNKQSFIDFQGLSIKLLKGVTFRLLCTLICTACSGHTQLLLCRFYHKIHKQAILLNIDAKRKRPAMIIIRLIIGFNWFSTRYIS